MFFAMLRQARAGTTGVVPEGDKRVYLKSRLSGSEAMTNFTEMELNVKITPFARLQEIFKFVFCVQKERIFWVGSAVNLHTFCVAVYREALRAYGVSLKEVRQTALDCRHAIPSFATKLSFGPQDALLCR